MVLYVEACESGSMFSDELPDNTKSKERFYNLLKSITIILYLLLSKLTNWCEENWAMESPVLMWILGLQKS